MAFSVMSRFYLDIRLIYRGVELRRRCELSGGTNLLSPG